MSRQQILATVGFGVFGAALAALGVLEVWRWFAVGLALLVTILALMVLSARTQVGGVSRHVLATERIAKGIAGRTEASRQRLEQVEAGVGSVARAVGHAAERNEKAERRLLSTHESGRLALETAANELRISAQLAAGRQSQLQESLTANHVVIKETVADLIRNSDVAADIAGERLAVAERRLLAASEALRMALEGGVALLRRDASDVAERLQLALEDTTSRVQADLGDAAEASAVLRESLQTRDRTFESNMTDAIEVIAARVGALEPLLTEVHNSSSGLASDYAELSMAYETVVDAVVRPVAELLGRIDSRRGIPVSESVLRIEKVLDDVHVRLRALAAPSSSASRDAETRALGGGDTQAATEAPIDDRLVIAELEQRLRDAVLRRRQDRLTPSFHEQYSDMRRQVDRAVVTDPEGWHPYRQTKRKLRNYELAASHGFRIPTIYRAWATLEDVKLAGLPDRFALKSDFGASGHGVLLLERTGEGVYRRLDRHDELDAAQIIAYLQSRIDRGDIEGPFFAESLLDAIGDELIPEDVKIYACYGQIAQVMLRRSAVGGGTKRASFRYLDESGEDLGRVASNRDIDPSIAVPESLNEMLDVARHLSRAIGTPLCRVDLYETRDGIVVGELTLTPGGPQTYEAEHDAAMGAVWRDGELARGLDLARGRPFGRLYGDQADVWLYPPEHASRSSDPGPWARTTLSCQSWCSGASAKEFNRDVAMVTRSEPGEHVQF